MKFYTEALGLKIATDQPFTEKQRWIELLFPGAETGVGLFTPEGHEKRIGEFRSIFVERVSDLRSFIKEQLAPIQHPCPLTQPISGRETLFSITFELHFEFWRATPSAVLLASIRGR